MDDERLVGREEAARTLGIPARSVYALARAGALPAVKVGRVWRFNLKHLMAWLTEQSSADRETEPTQIEAPTINADELDDAPLDRRLRVACLAEQRQTNRLLTRLLNRSRAR